ASAARSSQRSLPSSQSKDVVCRLSRSGTSMGSPSFAKVTRGDRVRRAISVVRSVLEAAKGGSFHRPMTESQARRTPVRAAEQAIVQQNSRAHGRRTAQTLTIHKIADGHKGRDATGPSASAAICLARNVVPCFLPVCLDSAPRCAQRRPCGRNSAVRLTEWREIGGESSSDVEFPGGHRTSAV